MGIVMTKRKSAFEANAEFQVYHHANGVKLISPDQKNLHLARNTHHTVADLLALPFSIYFEDSNGILKNLNSHNAQYCGFNTVKDAIEKPYYKTFLKKSAQLTTRNDQLIMKSQQYKILEEEVLRKDDTILQTLSIKFPWYNLENRVIGIFGCCILLDKNPLAYSLSLIAQLGLLKNIEKQSGAEIDNTYLSKQQLNCAKFLLNGMTSKEIALQLKLSPRTVETYLENLKAKLKCNNKADLLIKLSRYLN